MSSKMVRVSFTLPPDLVDDLRFVSGRLGSSRSACLSSLMRTPLSDLRSMLEAMPENPTPEDILRARGVSNGIILQRLGQYMNGLDGQGDLLDGSDH